MEKCKICSGGTKKVFTKTVLKKYEAGYFKCSSCGFVQTSEPVWIEEAYSSAITSLDIGLLQRNNQFCSDVSAIIDACFPESKNMLDYAGGYGVFVRLMRDKGYNFYRQDPFCENLFAKHFDITDGSLRKFDIVTAFEVFEHFVDPLPEIEKLLTYSENVIFSTTLTPPTDKELENWWYIAPETGQHVAFYSRKSMELIAEKHTKYYYEKDGILHLFTAKKLTEDQVDYAFKNVKYRTFLGVLKRKLDFSKTRSSLLEKDFEYIKGLINS
jgi:hypothetical protein